MQLADKNLLKNKEPISMGNGWTAMAAQPSTVTDPATGDSIAEVASCGTAETRRAIEAAEVAML